VRTRVVEDASELVAIQMREPWRVRVSERGEAVLLGRWREHLPDCAVLGLWCSPRRVPAIVADLLQVARAQGFEHLIGPLTPEREARPYTDAGLRVVQRVVVMRAERGVDAPDGRWPDLHIRPADPGDMDALLRLDAACFEPFWHYDLPSLGRLARDDRMVVGTMGGRIVGYTLSTLRAGDGSLGRLAVSPDHRRCGIGRHLASEAVRWLALSGARRVVLSTQEDNMASRALYRSIGFRETGDVLVACASGALSAALPDGAR
jgi:ribosomal-protein-alanine N-acetyltransferase